MLIWLFSKHYVIRIGVHNFPWHPKNDSDEDVKGVLIYNMLISEFNPVLTLWPCLQQELTSTPTPAPGQVPTVKAYRVLSFYWTP